MDYVQATTIAEVNTFQEAYSELMQSMMASSFNIANHAPDQQSAQRGVLRYIAYIFVEDERMLVEVYEQALSELNVG